MPEGPSLVISKEALQPFKGKKVIRCTTTANIDAHLFIHKKVVDITTWGKHLLICFPHQTIRIHFLLFGSYLINDTRAITPRLHISFSNGFVNFYTSSIQLIEQPLDDIYDWSADVMNEQWNEKAARKKLREAANREIGDVLLDQQIFAGVGNIIKNEVLFRIRVHPESITGNIPPAKIKALLKEAVTYSFEFLQWKKEDVLKKHWLAHTKKTCPRCHIPFIKKYTGKAKRRSFFCTNCQLLY
ncbi:endonuclease-8 [Filimonas lacunae]|uniref:Endonuclease-8 n=1 Tax=Filimonas lacunae TaxID=477680 RepID=A0A173MP03_9BACT|nr:endonuclease [Filimonas lacunae]BAV09199.1 endonuclease [Filimonas lacunae]SIS68812.1 endonuclease-8 [Filimonas lacunae]